MRFIPDDEDDLSTNSVEPLEFDRKDVINYLYPPTAIRTHVQKRTQILFLQARSITNTTSYEALTTQRTGTDQPNEASI